MVQEGISISKTHQDIFITDMSVEVTANTSEGVWEIIQNLNSVSFEVLPYGESRDLGPSYHVDTRKSLLLAMIILSLLGNFVVFCSFLPYFGNGVPIPKSKKMFLYLAIADCFVAFFALGAQLLWEQDKKYYFIDNISCKSMKFMQTYSLSLSGYMLVSIALDRYNAIVNALTRKRGIKWWVVFPWIISIVPAIPCPFLFYVPKDIGMCVSYFYSEKSRVDPKIMQFWRQVYVTTVCVIVFVIPTILLLFGYFGIYFKLSKQAGVFSSTEQTSSSLPRAKRKTFTLAAVITTAFLLTSIPYIVQEFYLAYGNPKVIEEYKYLVAWSGVVSAFNSVLNPYIYLMFQSTDSCCTKNLNYLIALIQSRRWSIQMPRSRKNTSVISVSSKTSKIDLNNLDTLHANSKSTETAIIYNSINKDEETCV